MNVFEMFGFFMIGSVFNMLIMLVFLFLLIGKIRKSLESNIGAVGNQLAIVADRADRIIKIFSRGEKNGLESEETI